MVPNGAHWIKSGGTIPLLSRRSWSRRRQPTAEIVAWHETLGYPETAGRPYVRVATGSWIEGTGGRCENQFVEGFLIDEDIATAVAIGKQSLAAAAGQLEPRFDMHF